ncbi:MAG: hypothetical protein P8Z68_07605, partial [Kineosporiaceae bacterium]
MGEQPALPGEHRAGAFLLRGGPFLGLGVLAVALPAAALVPLRLWMPAVALPVIVVGLALAWRISATVPVRPAPLLHTWLTAGIAAGFGLWAGLTHASNLILRRDPGSYALFAQWIGARHGLPVDAQLDAFGGAAVLSVPGITFGSPAYYEVFRGGGVEIVPQFLLGGPATYSLGWWLAGWTGLFWVGPLLGAFAVFGAGGLAARLIGPRWAPAAAGMLALTFPVLHSARSTYSETPALVVVLAAAALAVDAVRVDDPGRARRLALLAGSALGLAGLIRIDALTEVALLVPVAAVLALRGSPVAAPLAGGALGGIVVAAAPALGLSRPYLDSIRGSLLPLVAGTVTLVLGSAAAVVAGRRWQRRRGTATPGPENPATAGDHDGHDPAEARQEPAAGPDWWPDATWRPLGPWGRAGALSVLAFGVLLAARPLFLTSRQDPTDPGALYVAAMQASQHLPVDGGRTYAESTLQWVSWWLGPVAVGAAWIAFSVLAGRAVQWWRSGSGTVPGWLIPATVGVGSATLTLIRPGITPDHPWADRRLVTVLLPVFILGALSLVAWCLRWTRRHLPASLLTTASVAAALALTVPLLAATGPFAVQRTEVGEPSAVAAVCAHLHPGDVVLAVDSRGANEWPQVLRGACGVPAVALDPAMMDDGPHARAAAAAAVGRLVAARGGRLVLLAADSGQAGRNALTSIGQ